MYESELPRWTTQEETTVLILLHHRHNRELLAEELAAEFSVQTADSVAEEAAFDLCIADEEGLAANSAEIQTRRQRSEPLIQPYLLVTPTDIEDVDASVWELVDEVITTPISLAELYPRINALLRLRRLSIECRQKRQLAQVASVLSHDIRNPLSVAQGHLDLARERGDSEHLDQIETALDRIDNLVDDVLTLAKQEYTADDFSDVSLKTAATEAWNESEVGTASCNVDCTGDILIRANKSMLNELFTNLYRNAVEHNDPPVTVTVGCLTDGFYVADDGTGVPEGERPSVFELGHSTRPDGTGIGLAIVTQVADAHGWDVSITESTDGGARFEVTGVTPQTRTGSPPSSRGPD